MLVHFLSWVWTHTSCIHDIIICMRAYIVLILHGDIWFSYFSNTFNQTSRWARCLRVLNLLYIRMVWVTYDITAALLLMCLKLEIMHQTIFTCILRYWCGYCIIICLTLMWLFAIIEYWFKMSFSTWCTLIFWLDCFVEFTLSWLK